MLKTSDNNGNLKQQIYSNIFDRIIKGMYSPDTLINEKNLLEEFGVSKSPVREALIELCNEGVLRSIPRAGYQIVLITDKDIKDIQEYRTILECNSLDFYWDTLTNEHAERLNATLYEHYSDSAEYDVLEHWRLNSSFHLELMSFYQNKYLYENLASAVRFMTRAYAQFYWDKWKKPKLVGSAGCHKNLVTAIIQGEKSKAIKCLSMDISGFDSNGAGLTLA